MTAITGTEVGPKAIGELFAGIAELGALAPDRLVTGVFDDSRRVSPGGVFVAMRGSSEDGTRFIPQARNAGATVIVAEVDGVGDDCIRVPDARATLGRLAKRWYGLDSAAVTLPKLVGVTGTNGKSTTAMLTRAILEEAGQRCGLFGTIEYDTCGERRPATLTTPGPLELARLLRECVDHGADAVVMEASSHALDQGRLSGLPFAAAAFTNLSRDHLDYHATMDDYAEAKARLFDQIVPDGVAVLNADDPFAETMRVQTSGRVITYGLEQPADLTARISRESIGGTILRLVGLGHMLDLSTALFGRHNAYNILAASGLALALDAPPEAIARGLGGVDVIPGRLERVAGIGGFDVVVDYAHTPAALEAVCRALRMLVERRLIVVFGCGGDRDRQKRPLMGAAAARHAHAVIVTSDNPRNESPAKIIDDIIAGCGAGSRPRMLVEPDRRLAIEAALAAAHPGDVVLIAGKGHEDYQLVGSERRAFEDKAVAREVAMELGVFRTEEDAGP